MKSSATTVPAYLSELPADRRQSLSSLRKLIRKVAPDANEQIKYGHPHYDLCGPLFALAAQKHYLALYVVDHAVVAAHKGRIGKANFGKSCIRFKRLDALNMEAVESILAEAARSRRGSAAR
jgi:uncharacterized protein YdhG (YjbR/CyaY superfamily)